MGLGQDGSSMVYIVPGASAHKLLMIPRGYYIDNIVHTFSLLHPGCLANVHVHVHCSLVICVYTCIYTANSA